MKQLQDFRNLIEEEKSDYSKFDMLVRAGLANKTQLARIHRILDKMTEERPQFNNADREIMRNLFNRMVDLVANNKQVFQKTRQVVKEETDINEAELDTADIKIGPSGKKVRAHRFKVGDSVKEEFEIEESAGSPFQKDPPFVLVLRRKAIRLYPDGTKVALYYNQKLDKHFSVPYGENVDSPIQAEETSIDETIVKVGDKYRLVSKSSGKNLGTYDTKSGAENREKQVQYFKHHNEEVEQVEESIHGIEQLKKIKDSKQHGVINHKDGTKSKVDLFTASAILAVHNAVNDENKKKLNDMVSRSQQHLEKVANFAHSKAK